MKFLIFTSTTVAFFAAIATANHESIQSRAIAVKSEIETSVPSKSLVSSSVAVFSVVNNASAYENSSVVEPPVANGVQPLIPKGVATTLVDGPYSYSTSNSTSISQSSRGSNPSRVPQSSSSGNTGTRTHTNNSSGKVRGSANASAVAPGASLFASFQSGSIELTPAEIVGANPGPVMFDGPLPPVESSAVRNKTMSGATIPSRSASKAKEIMPSGVPMVHEIEDGQVQVLSGSRVGSSAGSQGTSTEAGGHGDSGELSTGSGSGSRGSGGTRPQVAPVQFEGGSAGKYIPTLTTSVVAGVIAFVMM